MPDEGKRQDMTDEEIRGVFTTLRLPLDGGAVLEAPQRAPLIFFRTTGYSPPLNAINRLGTTQPAWEHGSPRRIPTSTH